VPGRRPRRARADAPLDAKAATAAAFDLLARKAWSVRDLARRLGRRGATPETARAVVADLQARGYLDDEAFARWWAQARAERRRVGSRRLQQELRTRGIPAELAADAIAAAFQDGSELERALAAGRQRLPGLRGKPERVPARLFAYLTRRGYPPTVVRQVVRALCGADLDPAPTEDDERV
jgi:regulatory protein